VGSVLFSGDLRLIIIQVNSLEQTVERSSHGFP